MHSAKLTMTKFLPLLFVACGLQGVANAQDNSPYSRYGLGDLTPNHNIFSRGMGGITAGVLDYQSINFTNPATLGAISNTIFDIAAEADTRSLKSTNPAKKFTTTNAIFSYLQLGFPLTTPRMRKNNVNWGMSFGIRPVSSINYRIEKRERLTGIDSLHTLYEGSGGVNQAFLGTGFQFKDGYGKYVKKYSVGLNVGYMFGNKNYSTKLTFLNDSVDYYRSNTANETHFGGIFLNLGFQYEADMKKGILRIGLYTNMQQRINAKQDDIRETFSYDAAGNTYRVDSIYEQKDVKGVIIYPASGGIGFTFQGKHWLYGADLVATSWNNYRFYEKSDQLQNTWMVKAGTQYFPANENTPAKKYFSFVKYRAGLYYGPDYIKLGSNRPIYGISVGTGMPLTSLRRLSYTGEYVMLNTAVEVGNRGDKNSNLREGTMRISVGVSMNASWFQKRKYD